jgi:chemotaxis protein methyltransferase CheR
VVDGDAFLQWALPRLGLRWRGFRRVRRQVHRRILRRCGELGVGLDGYRGYLEAHADEWRVLDGLCRVTISRFYRDHAIWDRLVAEVLPAIAARGPARAWSAGCGAGEEPYTLAIAWRAIGGGALDIVATDIDDGQLARAAAATYPTGALRELPAAWRAAAFDESDGDARLRAPFRDAVRFAHHDVRTAPPAGPFDLILCRNQAFTYLDEAGQRAVAASFRSVAGDDAVLVVGAHEALPADVAGWQSVSRSLYRNVPGVRRDYPRTSLLDGDGS